MKEIQIRGKWTFALLFTCMLVFGIYEKRQQGMIEAALQTVPKTNIQRTNEELPPRVALTFDDGPHPQYTKTLLDGLKKRGIKATFFVVGENIAGQEDVIRQMKADGHLIGNHTYLHTDLSKIGFQKAYEELEKTESLIREITGSPTGYLRPPFGNRNPELEEQLSMLVVGWTVDPMDWAVKDTAQVVEKVVTQVKDNDIILLHDCYSSSIEAALQIVDYLTARGFVFVTAEELLLE